MTYKEQLKTDAWKQKRQKVLQRDNNKCRNCYKSNNLQVHHIIYINKRMCWQYPMKYLITLCSDCHKLIHNILPSIVLSSDSVLKITYNS